jgi:hypothetical protein
MSARILSRPASLASRSVVRRFSAADPEKVEYVHPLSQIVLEHLQGTRREWVTANGLDRGLTLQRDGTFEIRFPSSDDRIW